MSKGKVKGKKKGGNKKVVMTNYEKLSLLLSLLTLLINIMMLITTLQGVV